MPSLSLNEMTGRSSDTIAKMHSVISSAIAQKLQNQSILGGFEPVPILFISLARFQHCPGLPNLQLQMDREGLLKKLIRLKLNDSFFEEFGRILMGDVNQVVAKRVEKEKKRHFRKKLRSRYRTFRANAVTSDMVRKDQFAIFPTPEAYL